MQLHFDQRQGDHVNFRRRVAVKIGEKAYGWFVLAMRTVGKDRLGEISTEDGRVVWKGKLPEGPPPTRAFAVAAGLCDENGNTDIDPPNWIVR